MLNIRIHQVFNHIDLSSQILDPGQQQKKQMYKLAMPYLKHKTCWNVTDCVCCNTPGSDHHIDEEWEQVIHAPQEVAVQHGTDFLGQLFKCLLDDNEFV